MVRERWLSDSEHLLFIWILESHQHPYGGSQPSITPVAKDLTTSSGLHRQEAYKWCVNMHAGKTIIHIKIYGNKW